MKNKSLAIILSVVASCLLWLYVITFVNPVITTTVTGVPVQILGADSLGAQGQTVDGISHKSISVTITGSRSETAQITAQDIIAMVDVSGQPNGENEVRVNVSVPTNIEIKEVKPNRVSVRVDDYVNEIKPYAIDYTGNLPAGYELGFFHYAPETVTVSGSRTRVGNVDAVHFELDLAKLTKNGYQFDLPLTPMNEEETEVEYVTLSQGTVQGAAYLCETKEVPVVLTGDGEIPEGYELVPGKLSTIKVRAANFNLNELTEIQTLVVPVPEEGETLTATLVPLFPEGVELASGYDNLETDYFLREITEAPETDGEENGEVQETE